MEENMSRTSKTLSNQSNDAEPEVAIQESVGGIKSVEKAAVLLQALVQMRGPARLVDLAAAAGMSRSMARAYLISLLRSDLIRQNVETGRYDLGPAAAAIGFAALARIDFLQLAKAAMIDLSEQIQETVILTVWNVKGPVVVAKADGSRSAVYDIRIGSHVSLEPTSTGHIFIAYLPQEMWLPLLGEVYGFGEAPVTPMSKSEIECVIREIRKTRISVMDVSPTLPGFGGISAPVFDQDNQLKGVMTVVISSAKLAKQPKVGVIKALTAAAMKLSHQLGAAVKDLPDDQS